MKRSRKKIRSARHAPRRQGIAPADTPTASLVDVMPSWEGSPGFHPVAIALNTILKLPPLARTASGTEVIGTGDVIAFQALEAMMAARPVYIGAEQLRALPDWSEGGARDATATGLRYAAQLRLPFDPLFLDFTDPDGSPCWVGTSEEYALYGALLFTGESHIPGALVQHNSLALIPFGAANRDGAEVRRPWAVPEHTLTPMQAPIGALIVGEDPVRPGGEVALGFFGARGIDEWMRALMGVLPAGLASIGEPPLSIQTRARVYVGTGGISRLLGAFADHKHTSLGLKEIAARYPDDAEALIGEGLLVQELALSALRALFLLDSSNVEIVAAPVSRQVRRAVERSQGHRQIAMSVQVRARQHASKPRKAGERKREFSHSFERRGVYRHVTRGPHAKPEHMKPCPRDDAAHRASGGLCRREWVPGHVVSAGEGKPFVPKTRRVV